MIRSVLPRPAGLAGLSPARRGALIFVVAGLVFVATDALTKSLVADVPVVHVVLGRNIAYLLAVVVLAGRWTPGRLFVTARPWTQLARGLAMFGTTATFFLALSLLPLAEVSTLSSTTPLIVVGLAGPLLGEQVTRAAIMGSVVGFGGVLVLVGIDPAHVDIAMVVPLANAAIFAAFSMLTRALHTEPPEVTMFYSGLIPMIAAIVLVAVVPTTTGPEPWQWAAIGVVGLSALTGHRLLVAAYRWGRASDLAPLGYLNLVWAFAIGAAIFGEAIEGPALVGAAAITVGGVIVLRSAPGGEEVVQASADYAGPVDTDP